MYLANDQPFLSNAENLRNRADFEEITERLAQRFYEAQIAATVAPWLRGLVRGWRSQQAYVINMNYDLVIEDDVANDRLDDVHQPAAANYLWPIDVPMIGSRYHAVLSGDGNPEPIRMAKLHGSIGFARPIGRPVGPSTDFCRGRRAD